MIKISNIETGKFICRYKRFLTDVELSYGSVITVHCPNSGRMTSCTGEGYEVVLSKRDNPKRKYPYTLELINNGKCWICANTGRANEVAYEAVSSGDISELAGYEEYTREVKYSSNSRIDILGSSGDKKCYIEVKSVTLVNDDGVNSFPDAPTKRGRKHLNDLMNMVKQGHRAVMLYIVMRSDGESFVPAADIDPEYAQLFDKAVASGVEVYVYGTNITLDSISIGKSIPLY